MLRALYIFEVGRILDFFFNFVINNLIIYSLGVIYLTVMRFIDLQNQSSKTIQSHGTKLLMRNIHFIEIKNLFPNVQSLQGFEFYRFFIQLKMCLQTYTDKICLR